MTPFQAKVDRVIDGDTLWLRVRLRLRSSAPEARAAGGAEATAALKRAHPHGQAVEVEPITTDVYGRLLGTIRALSGGEQAPAKLAPRGGAADKKRR